MVVGLKERLKLTAERWLGPYGTERAMQMLSTILSPDIPAEHNAPVTLNAKNGVPPLQIRNWNPGDILIQITNESGNPVGNVTVDGSGLHFVDEDGEEVQDEEEQEPAEQTEFIGEVLSGGPGAGPYLVRITDNQGGTADVLVTQQQINAGQTVPAGAVTTVFSISGSYFMQVSVI